MEQLACQFGDNSIQEGFGVFPRLLLLLSLLAAAALAQNNSVGHIDGVVVNQATGEPVKKAMVFLYDLNVIYGTNGPSRYSTSADLNGGFAIDQITPGRYTIVADRPGFLPETYRVSGTSSIMIGPGQSLGGLRLQLAPQGSISGRVLDEDGDPITDVRLQVQKWSVINGVRRLNGAGRGNDSADDQGNFRISGLDPGRYIISATYYHYTRVFNREPVPAYADLLSQRHRCGAGDQHSSRARGRCAWHRDPLAQGADVYSQREDGRRR
jgi:hypothetical protein